MLFEEKKKQNSMVASRGWQLEGIIKKKTDKGRLLYIWATRMLLLLLGALGSAVG
jgi:hypothetical protein